MEVDTDQFQMFVYLLLVSVARARLLQSPGKGSESF